MGNSTQNTNLATVMKPTDQKLSGTQQKEWASMVVAKMNQELKSKSINQVLWGDQKKEG